MAKARFRALEMRGEFGRSAQWGEGIFENRYTKIGGSWRVSSVHFYRTFLANYAGGWAASALPLPGIDHRLPPDFPPTLKYQSYPEQFVPPFHRAYPEKSLGHNTHNPAPHHP